MLEERIDALVSQLSETEYGVNPFDLVRFRADPADETITGIVRQVVADGAEGAELFRASPSESLDLIGTHALRRTLQARRQSSLAMAMDALDAYALVAVVADVPWATWVMGALYFARELGGDVVMLHERFASIASARSSARFEVALDALRRVSDLSRCRLSEVSTTYGAGLVENPELSDMPGRGLYPSPALGHERIGYEPRTNLAQLSVDVADALDATHLATSAEIVQDQLPTTLVPAARTGPYLRTSACLRFMARAGESSFIAYVAELSDEEDQDVEELGESARGVEGQLAVCDERRLIVMSPQPTFEDSASGDVDLIAFEQLSRSALASSSTPFSH